MEEIYNFTQDDLLTEDILILDTHAEVFVWVGQCVDLKEKQNAFEIGKVCLNINIFHMFPFVALFIHYKKICAEIHSDGGISRGAAS